MVACFEVFQTWDDEYEKLQVLLRDIVKRKREENLKMVWRINPAHRKLQARLDQMRKFRRQHEQLRAVIVRVLRPQVVFHSFLIGVTAYTSGKDIAVSHLLMKVYMQTQASHVKMS